MVDMCHRTFVMGCSAPGVKPEINYGLWTIMKVLLSVEEHVLFWCRMWTVREALWGGDRGYMRTSWTFQFFRKRKTALKIVSLIIMMVIISTDQACVEISSKISKFHLVFYYFFPVRLGHMLLFLYTSRNLIKQEALKTEVGGYKAETTMCKINNPQGYIVQPGMRSSAPGLRS